MFRINYTSLAEIGKDLGEAKAVDMFNKHLANQNYRKGYNAVRNETFKAVRNDPRFKDLVTKARTETRKNGK